MGTATIWVGSSGEGMPQATAPTMDAGRSDADQPTRSSTSGAGRRRGVGDATAPVQALPGAPEQLGVVGVQLEQDVAGRDLVARPHRQMHARGEVHGVLLAGPAGAEPPGGHTDPSGVEPRATTPLRSATTVSM